MKSPDGWKEILRIGCVSYVCVFGCVGSRMVCVRHLMDRFVVLYHLKVAECPLCGRLRMIIELDSAVL